METWGMAALSLALAALAHSASAEDWSYYGHDAGSTRFSPLAQITPANAAELKPAWTFHTGDISDGKNGVRRSGFESTPLFLDGRLYLTTPFNRVIALNPASGAELWSHDPKIDRQQPYGDGMTNRGLAAWRNPRASDCRLTLFEATLDARLIALDATTGKPCVHFGDRGEVSLRDVSAYHAGWYHMTSPPIVVDGVVVVGSAIDDNSRVDMPSGVVRGFDAATGKLLWRWDPVTPPAGTAAGDWNSGAANAWSILSADPRRHLVYVPTGSASPDYFGGYRPGDNRWANSVVALDARTGIQAWGFQLVHHDLWDYDTAATPLRTTITIAGKRRDVVIAGNKTGMVYVLDAATGKPALPVEERTVPTSDVAGETTSPTQPYPVSTPPLARQTLPPQEAFGISDADRAACRDLLAKAPGTSLFTPPSTSAGLEVPGILGGINWSGFAWDQAHQRLIAVVSNLPYRVQLIARADFKAGQMGDFRGAAAPQSGAPFAMTRTPLLAPSGVPCTPPPWGELVAVDLAGGRIAWRQPVGSMDEVFPGLSKAGAGSAMLGGAIVTAGGLVFIGATLDHRFHALSSETGHELWSADLPAGAHAQPITYRYRGKQYVVVAAGGSAPIAEERRGDALVAFALP